jgi:ABC-type branched-subunit amino acid transport system ATPase component
VQPDSFGDTISIDVVAAAVLGGLAYSGGPLLGALYIFAVPQFVQLDSASLAGTALGWLLLVMYVPGGLGSLIGRGRDWLITRLTAAEAAGPERVSSLAEHRVSLAASADAVVAPSSAVAADTGPILVVEDVRKRFGGVHAVAGVTLEVRRGEVLGLIGPNGAGKTTLFEILSGFTKPDSGRVRFDGRDITRMPPETRARLGLVRSFQDSRLFPTMTVLEALKLAQERDHPVSIAGAIFAGGPGERQRDRRARELVDLMGLGGYADKRINELSTGTRRITEIACVVSLRPRLLLLDEPSTGIAQRESEALGDLLRQVRDYLGATLVVIEHDVPLIMGLADRIAAMESGALLLVDEPAVVAKDQRVIESYLGGDPRAIARSGVAKTAKRAPRKKKLVPAGDTV